MKDKEIHDSFEDATAWYIAQQMHTEVSITGGEPLLALPHIIMFSQIIRYFNPDVKLWLYTNGMLLTKDVAMILKAIGIDGISISLHKLNNWLWLPHFWDIHANILPVRYLVGEDELTKDISDHVATSKIPMRVWKMDDCNDMPFESRYRLHDPEMRWC
jgi:hypothetical protein